MRKKILFFIGIVLLCLAGWGIFLYNKPHKDVSSTKTDVAIDATLLYKRYSENEAIADKQFLNKIISVTGRVDDISRTDSTCIVLLKQVNETGGISCNLFAPASTRIQQGNQLTIKGRCTGFLMDVALTDCIIEQQ